MNLSSHKLLFTVDCNHSKEHIRKLVATYYNIIKDKHHLSECNSELSIKHNYVYLQAWPYALKVFINGNDVSIYFVNECEGVSHEEIRYSLKEAAEKIKDACMRIT